MIFRVIDNKLYQVKIRIKDEDKFIQKNKSLKFIKVSNDKLPVYKGEKTDEVFYMLDSKGNIVIDTDRTSQRATEYKENKKQDYLNRLLELCDRKTQEVKNYINGEKVTEGLIERYQAKEQMAKAYLADGSSYKDELQVEADLKGISVDDLAKLIVSLADKFKSKLDYFYSLIEAFRVKTKSLILNYQFDDVDKIVMEASGMGANSTPDDIKNLFANIDSASGEAS